MYRFSETMDEYSLLVRTLALRRDGHPLYNESIDHASIVVENLFRSARKSIDVLSGDMNPRVFGRNEVIEEANLFLISNPEHKIRVILEKDLPNARKIHPFFKKFGNLPNVELHIAPAELQARYNFHFIVVDEDCYRFENDRTLPAAVVAFGDQDGATHLGSLYDKLWSKSAQVPALPNAQAAS